jgi:methylglyoxal reductase
VLLETPLGLGTAPLGSTPDGPLRWGPQNPDVSVATVEAAIDAGVGWIDTAPFYGWGLAERIVGQALATSPRKVRVLTKCGTQRGTNDDGSERVYEDASPIAVRRGVHDSLERLGLDFIDVVQVHDPDPSTPIEDTWAELMELVEEGVIGGAGLSNHSPELMDRAARVGPVVVVQHQYSLLHRVPETDGVLDWCATHNVPFLAWSPLASGFLTDGFDVDDLVADDLRRGLRWAADAEQPRVRRILAELSRIAAGRRATVAMAALAWATHRPACHAIVGARSPAEARALADPPELADEDVAALDRASGE